MFSYLHPYAVQAAHCFRLAESELVVLLQKIDACKGFSELGYPSLFTYVNEELGLSEASAQQLITVSRKAREVPALQLAIAQGELTVSKANAIVSLLTVENQEEWIGKAKALSARSLEKAVAEARPEVPQPERIRPIGHGMSRLELSVDEETLRAIQRTRELLAQKYGRPVTNAEALKVVLGDFVDRHDPVAKADRSAQNTLHATRARHAVHRRDRGACQFRQPNGKICGSRQWLHVHHVRPRSEGGQDTEENMVTYCAAHHGQVHAG